MLCGSDKIMRNILHIHDECEEYSTNKNVSPTKHCYGYGQCYERGLKPCTTTKYSINL